MRRTFASVLLASTLGAALAAPSSTAIPNREVVLPSRATVRIPSPDRRWLLIASPFQRNAESSLVLTEVQTGRELLRRPIDRSIAVAWSPDSRGFFLNDAYGSNVESAYIYHLGAPSPLKLDDLILAADPQASAIPADHVYFHVYRWVTPRTLLAEYCGHTTDLVPGKQFDFLYRVVLDPTGSKAVTVRQISSRVHPPSFAAGAECTK
jgi:hypothetical protein